MVPVYFAERLLSRVIDNASQSCPGWPLYVAAMMLLIAIGIFCLYHGVSRSLRGLSDGYKGSR